MSAITVKLDIEDIVLSRDADGTATMNIPRRVIHHNPTGIEWGHHGSGPADAALSILDRAVPPGADGLEPVECFKGTCSSTAWRLHQEFKRMFLADMPQEGDTISADTLREFLRVHGIEAD